MTRAPALGDRLDSSRKTLALTYEKGSYPFFGCATPSAFRDYTGVSSGSTGADPTRRDHDATHQTQSKMSMAWEKSSAKQSHEEGICHGRC
jgi:hypothetical protein